MFRRNTKHSPVLRIIGNFNLQIQMSVTNTNQSVTITPDMYIVAVYDGTLVVSNSSAMASIGVVSKEEVLNAPMSDSITFNELEKIYGGSFFSKFKDYALKANAFLRKYKPISKITGYSGNPYVQGVSQVAQLLGYGEGEGVQAGGYGTRAGACRAAGTRHCERGGVLYGGEGEGEGGELYGGRKLNRAEMRKRLNM